MGRPQFKGEEGFPMSLKKRASALLALICILLSSCAQPQVKNETAVIPDVTGKFEFSILKVGQADAIILKTENHCVIIDCGEADDGDEVVDYLNDNNIEFVDYLFITHFDKDHVGGVPEVLDGKDVGEIITPDYESGGEEYEYYLETVADLGLSPKAITENMSFTLDDVLFNVYPPQKRFYDEDDNDFSIAIAVYHGGNSFLFTGDAESDRSAEIMNQTDFARFDFLKVPHHGKYNKNTKKLFETVQPKYAVIACSDKNPPSDRVLEALEAVGCETYETRNGDVTVTSDGSAIVINQ